MDAYSVVVGMALGEWLLLGWVFLVKWERKRNGLG